MKTSIATSLSIVGVLTAGAAAFAVNTAVLDFSSSDNVEAVQAADDTNSAVTTQETASGSTSAAGVQSVPPTKSPITSTSPNTPQTQQVAEQPTAIAAVQATPAQTSTYKVGDAGRVILEVRDNSLYVANVLPSADWKASRPEYDDGEVEVEFFSGSTEVEFKARLVNGEIKVFVESENEDEDDSYEREYKDDHDDDEYERDDD